MNDMRLPSNFQEIIILKEIKYNNGDRNTKLIKELLFLYSLCMEYYDRINSLELYSHYWKKIIPYYLIMR